MGARATPTPRARMRAAWWMSLLKLLGKQKIVIYTMSFITLYQFKCNNETDALYVRIRVFLIYCM